MEAAKVELREGGKPAWQLVLQRDGWLVQWPKFNVTFFSLLCKKKTFALRTLIGASSLSSIVVLLSFLFCHSLWLLSVLYASFLWSLSAFLRIVTWDDRYDRDDETSEKGCIYNLSSSSNNSTCCLSCHFGSTYWTRQPYSPSWQRRDAPWLSLPPCLPFTLFLPIFPVTSFLPVESRLFSLSCLFPMWSLDESQTPPILSSSLLLKKKNIT